MKPERSWPVLVYGILLMATATFPNPAAPWIAGLTAGVWAAPVANWSIGKQENQT